MNNIGVLKNNFITIAHIEGISYLILLLIAVPFKYFLDLPQMVTFIGLLHGLLFLLFAGFWLYLWNMLQWPLGKAAWIFALSLIPFGTFYIKTHV